MYLTIREALDALPDDPNDIRIFMANRRYVGKRFSSQQCRSLFICAR